MANQLSTYRKGKRSLIDDASTGSQMPPRVSINGNRFTLIDPSGTATEVPFLPDGPALDVVFVDGNEHSSKLFWGIGKTYNPSELSPPVCFSDNGVAPSSLALEPQHPTCAACPHNVIGSAISQVSGARIKACGDLKKWAVVVDGFQGVYLLTIKPGSFKAWNNYVNFLRLQKLADGGRPDLADVVTRIRFSGQGVHSFEAIGLVEEGSDLATQAISVWEKNEETDITGMMVGRYDVPAQGMPAKEVPAPVQKVVLPPQQFTPPSSPPNPFAQQQALAEQVKKVRAKKEEKPAEIMPAPPAEPPAKHGLRPAPQSAPPADVSARLQSLFKLPSVK
jgi:hypothetical protein